jgi:hypothetical protein
MSLFPVTIHPKKHLSHAAVLIGDILVPGVRVPSLRLFEASAVADAAAIMVDPTIPHGMRDCGTAGLRMNISVVFRGK